MQVQESVLSLHCKQNFVHFFVGVALQSLLLVIKHPQRSLAPGETPQELATLHYHLDLDESISAFTTL